MSRNSPRPLPVPIASIRGVPRRRARHMTTGLVSTPRHRAAWATAHLLLLLAVACSSSSSTQGTVSQADAVRFLEQSTFGPTEALVANVQGSGFAAFLDAQVAAPPSS